MGELQKIADYQKQLQKLCDTDSTNVTKALEFLHGLEKCKMTLELLRETKVGKTIKLAKKTFDSSECRQLCSNIISEWRKLQFLPTEGDDVGSDSSVSHATTPVKQQTSALAKRRISADVEGVELTGDPTRDSCRKMIANALKTDDISRSYNVGKIASGIEQAIFNLYKGDIGAKYKAQVRSRRANLADAKNTALRLAVLKKEISPQRLAEMTAQELANDEVRKEIEKAQKEACLDAQIGGKEKQRTTQFRCDKCGQWDTAYYEMQTRSADEPMTVFIECQACNFSWTEDGR